MSENDLAMDREGDQVIKGVPSKWNMGLWDQLRVLILGLGSREVVVEGDR